MTRACVDCGAKISAKSSGRCRRCAMTMVNRLPEKRAICSAALAKRRLDPHFTAARSRAVRRGVPDERWGEYQRLRNIYGAAEARRMILADEAARARRQIYAITDRMRAKHEREMREAY